MSNMRLRTLYVLLISLTAIMFPQILSASASRPTGDGKSGVIFFKRDTSTSSSDISVRLLAFDLNTNQEYPVTPDTDLFAYGWSHDGKRILGGEIRGDAPFSLVVIEADGKNRRRLIDAKQVKVRNPQWSLDDKRILFWGSPVHETPRYWAIFDIPAEGGEIRRLSPLFPLAGIGELAFSPDGSQLLFTHDSRLFRMSSMGGEAVSISFPFHLGSDVKWSPDGTQIAVQAYTPGPNMYTNRFEGLYLITPDGHNRRLVVAGSEDEGWTISPQWSLDGSQLLFITKTKIGVSRTFGIVDMRSGDVRTYHTGEGVLSSLTWLDKGHWSPDGTQIAFTAVDGDSKKRSLYVVDRNFTQIRRLTEGQGSESIIQWRP